MRRFFPIGVATVVVGVLVGGCGATSSSSPPTEASTSTTNTATSTAATAPTAPGWIALPPAPLGGRVGIGALWTGTEMLVVGGIQRIGSIDGALPDGVAYNPATRTWRTLPASPDGPLGAVTAAGSAWTGDTAVFWAGNSPDGPAHGAVYDPSSDSWRKLPDGPLGIRDSYASVWTGTELLLFGGNNGDTLATPFAAAVEPRTGDWRLLHGFDAVAGFAPLGAVWDGHEAFLSGRQYRCPEPQACNMEWRPGTVAYDPATDTLRTIDVPLALAGGSPLLLSPVAWTGDSVLLTTPETTAPRLFSYRPADDSWKAVAASPCPLPDYYGITAWIGDRLVATCGDAAMQIYTPATDTWEKLATGHSTVPSRALSAFVWTGSELIVWGGTVQERLNPTPADGAALMLDE